MSIAALITEGVGPGGSVPYILTGGLDVGDEPDPGNRWTPVTVDTQDWTPVPINY